MRVGFIASASSLVGTAGGVTGGGGHPVLLVVNVPAHGDDPEKTRRPGKQKAPGEPGAFVTMDRRSHHSMRTLTKDNLMLSYAIANAAYAARRVNTFHRLAVVVHSPRVVPHRTVLHRGPGLSAAASTVLTMTAIDTEQLEDQEPDGLTEDELAMLELEASWWKYAAVKESLVRDRFEISSTVYYARLNALIDRPEALAAAPLVVRRLQRLREQRRHQRSARRLDA